MTISSLSFLWLLLNMDVPVFCAETTVSEIIPDQNDSVSTTALPSAEVGKPATVKKRSKAPNKSLFHHDTNYGRHMTRRQQGLGALVWSKELGVALTWSKELNANEPLAGAEASALPKRVPKPKKKKSIEVSAESNETPQNGSDHTDEGDEPKASKMKKPKNLNRKPIQHWQPVDYSSWAPIKKKLWDQVPKDPNRFYYHFGAPGVEVSADAFSESEQATFIELLRLHPPQGQWGLFAMHMPGRTGSQCAKFFKELDAKNLAGFVGSMEADSCAHDKLVITESDSMLSPDCKREAVKDRQGRELRDAKAKFVRKVKPRVDVLLKAG
jgi:hypothetical protein